MITKDTKITVIVGDQHYETKVIGVEDIGYMKWIGFADRRGKIEGTIVLYERKGQARYDA